MPSLWQFAYSPEPARSVPPLRVTLYCSAVSTFRHSSSDFTILSPMGWVSSSSIGQSSHARPALRNMANITVIRALRTVLSAHHCTALARLPDRLTLSTTQPESLYDALRLGSRRIRLIRQRNPRRAAVDRSV